MAGERENERVDVETAEPRLERSMFNNLSLKAAAYHGRMRYINKLPFPVFAIIVLVAVANILLWAGIGVVLHCHSALISTALLSYTLGLCHALDADHICAIDLITRRLIASGQQPVTVGTFFSLGHSTIVVVTCIVVAATASAFSEKFTNFSRVGGIIGTSISASFLLLLGVVNAYILVKLIVQMRKLIASSQDEEDQLKIQGGGFLFRIFQKLFKLIDRPWKSYPLGVLFGLGFDTSTEIALLGIASLQAARGTSIWLILIFPVLFTAGMCLLDTADGALMMTLYTSARLAQDKIAVLYYSIVLTAVTVAVAVVIGTVQALSLALAVNPGLEGKAFWKGVVRVENRWDVVGGAICGSFLVFGLLSVVLYEPWRRQINQKRAALRLQDSEQSGSEMERPGTLEGVVQGTEQDTDGVGVSTSPGSGLKSCDSKSATAGARQVSSHG